MKSTDQQVQDQIIMIMAEATLTEVARQLEFCVTRAHPSAELDQYIRLLKEYLIDRINHI
jgi:hypothetical protein